MRKIFYLLFPGFVLLYLPSCGQQTFEEKLEDLYSHTIPKITHDSLIKLMRSGNDSLVILDTRSWKEYEVSHIKGAIWVGYEDFETSRVEKIPKNATIITYCTVGYRSEKVGEELKEDGYKKIFNLYGSIAKWVNNGHPVYNLNGQKTSRVHTYNKRWSKWFKKGNLVYE